MERSEVKAEYKWKIEDIFATDEEWEQSFKETQKSINFAEFAGKLSDSGILLKLLKKIDAVSRLLDRLGVYANMRHDEDTSAAKYTAYYAKVSSLYSEFSTELAFFEPEMAAQDDEYLQSLIADSRFSDYDYELKRIKARKAHVLSEAEERLIGMAGETFDTFRETFGMIDNADLPQPEITFGGEKIAVTHGAYGVIMRSEDRAARKEAYEKYYNSYISLINTITSTYHGNVKKNVFLSKAYKFSSCLERALFDEDVGEEVYNNLLSAVSENLASMHRYIADRKKILGYDKQYFYDIYAPLCKGGELELGFEEAYKKVIEGLSPLGDEYIALLKRGKEERWIDVEETRSKRSGAYSIGCNGVHPFVLLNYKPSITEVFTIAHEMGHSLHTYFSDKNQPYAKSGYTIFVAEVASTVNEVLLLKYLLSETDDVNLKKYLLNYYLDMIRTTLHRQTMFAEFEYEAHSMVERGEPLTRENLCGLYAGLNKRYYGDAIEHDGYISHEWARIPHFYRAFYVYKYATGITAAINIAERILSEGKPAVDDYFRFLSGGGSTDPVSLLKLAGVDLSDKRPFAFAMAEFDKTLTEFEKLMGI